MLICPNVCCRCCARKAFPPSFHRSGSEMTVLGRDAGFIEEFRTFPADSTVTTRTGLRASRALAPNRRAYGCVESVESRPGGESTSAAVALQFRGDQVVEGYFQPGFQPREVVLFTEDPVVADLSKEQISCFSGGAPASGACGEVSP